MTLLSLEGCSRSLGDRVLFRDVSLNLGEGERVGLLGRNGSGKSTLLRVLAGVETPDEGRRSVRRDLKIGYLPQEPEVPSEKTLRAVVRGGFEGRQRIEEQLRALHDELARAQESQLARLLARQARLEVELENQGGHDIDHRIESTLQALGLEEFDRTCAELSGGERRRVALARLLLAAPELLILDEPTNHLDALVTDWLEDWLLETGVPLLIVTHDRYFLDRVVDRILELDRGRLVEYQGGYDDYLRQKAARAERERRDEASRRLLLRRETAWIRRGPPARTSKSKARIHRYQELVADEPELDPADLEFTLPPGPRLGSRVVRLEGVTKSFGGRVVVPPIDLELSAGMRLGIVGPNGAGKTTLLRMLRGELECDGGVREVGETVAFMGIDQARADLDPLETTLEAVAGKSDVVRKAGRVVRVRGFLDKFGFPAAMQDTRIQELSGGERARVLLAKLLCAEGNVLLLDEPTNDLDLATLRALEEALIAFRGAAVIVSHDRWFLDRVATHILYLDGQGGAGLHVGDLTTLLAELAAKKARAAKSRPTESRPAGVDSAAESPPRARKLAPWEERELEEALEGITRLEEELAAIDVRLADPALYTGPPEKAEAVRRERAAVAAELESLLARWEELETGTS